jgi:general nucleoside transport system permease protein
MTEFFTFSSLASIAFLTIRLATPYLYASTGETITQKSGTLNLGNEGMMLMGSFIAFSVAVSTGNLWLGALMGAITGMLFGLMMAFVVVSLQGVQPIAGIGINMLGLGLSSIWFVGTITIGTTISGFPAVKIPLLSDIPLIGEVLFNHNVLVYGAYLIIPLISWLLNKTTVGLKIRAVGENPAAADSLGINVAKIRYLSLGLGGTLAGLGGAALSIGILNLFQEDLTAGIGLISVGLVVFGGWSPWGVLRGALLFSVLNAIQLWVQAKDLPIPSDLAAMLPAVAIIVVLALGKQQRSKKPAALVKPFRRGEH